MSVSEDSDPERAQARQAVRQASSGWAEAMRAHRMAHPDAGFAARLRDLADAAHQEQIAWRRAHEAGLLWQPISGAENAQPPYELRPGTGRRGPVELWERFDQAVADLNRAISGTDAAAVADAFQEMGDAAGALADAVSREDVAAPAARARGAA